MKASLVAVSVFMTVLASNAAELACDVPKDAQVQQWISLDGGSWQPFSKERAEAGADTVEVAKVRHGNQTLVEIQSDTAGDFATYHRLCYDGTGKLIRSNYEVRTAWGWGYAEGVGQPYFFDLETNKRIPRPSDTVGLEKHKTYKALRDLPFAKLITAKNQQPITNN